MAKYKNYAELALAFKSGELDTHYRLILDKGRQDNSLIYFNPKLSDEENEAKSDECRQMFNGRRPVDELFKALGIPFEWC